VTDTLAVKTIVHLEDIVNMTFNDGVTLTYDRTTKKFSPGALTDHKLRLFRAYLEGLNGDR
jgi:hypothetical protein